MKVDYKFVPKGWGFEKWLCNNEKYCGKLLFIAKGKRISWHYHEKKEEHFYVHSGKLIVLYGYEKDIEHAYQTTLSQGDVFHVPVGMVHRLIALEDSEVFEFSTQHFDEDSIRVEKGD